MKVGISKCDRKFEFYVDWLRSLEVEFEVLDYHDKNFDRIRQCGALILTGGNDISARYSHVEGTSPIPERDDFEAGLLDYALTNELPVLGICRGMQFINCRMGGTLISDIVSAGMSNHDALEGIDSLHAVEVRENSLLKEITGRDSGMVNSSHHQGIKEPGIGLIISAVSTDGVPEAIEWGERENKPFLLGVQWHPERMADKGSPFCVNILKKFKDEVNR